LDRLALGPLDLPEPELDRMELELDRIELERLGARELELLAL